MMHHYLQRRRVFLNLTVLTEGEATGHKIFITHTVELGGDADGAAVLSQVLPFTLQLGCAEGEVCVGRDPAGV